VTQVTSLVATPVDELDLPYFDNGSARYEADPYGVIEELRAKSWLVRSRYGYTVLTFAEAMEIKKSTSFVRIFDAVRPDESEYLFDKANRSVSAQSGPTLVRMRRALLRALRPRTVGQLRPQMGAIFNDLLDNLDLLGSPDIVRDAVERYPGLVMAPILGVPFAETRELDHWASTINILGNHPAYAARLGDVEQAYRNMEAYLREVIADRRAHPSTDVLGELIAGADEDPEISEDELLMLAHAIVNASIDNVRSQLALTVEALVRHPAQWDALRAEPALLEAAVEEGLRYLPAGDDTQHRVPETAVMRGMEFPAGALVFINKKAVNRDPEAVDGPHEFRLDRATSPHLTFGFGLHSCVGATLARAAISEGVSALSQRVVSWQLVGEPERGPMASGGAPRALPLEFSLRPRRQDTPRVLCDED
jgi:cytochrome P450